MVADVIKAPYASTVIPISLTSITGIKYRILNCLECGTPFLQRESDVLYRLNDVSSPTEIAIIDGVITHAMCGVCSQEYAVQVATNMKYDRDGIPLYIQPQSIYIVIESSKRLRFLHCLECGGVFHSISDRIASVSDNRIPFEYVNAERLGPIEANCRQNKCAQAWSLMV